VGETSECAAKIMRHAAEAEEQAEAQQAFAEAARKVAEWFDAGVRLAAELDRLQMEAAGRWPNAVLTPGMLTLPPGCGFPTAPREVLQQLYGVGDRAGLATNFKRSLIAWNRDVLDPADPERRRAERVAELEAAGDELAQARIAAQNKEARLAEPGIHQKTVASPPRYGKIVGPQAPAIAPTAAPLEDPELERLRVELGKASANYVNVSAAHYRHEASDSEMELATETLRKAKEAFAAREREISSPAEKAFAAVGPSWMGQ
jgi:hypothetical protein